jgi:hypothetical protein
VHYSRFIKRKLNINSFVFFRDRREIRGCAIPLTPTSRRQALKSLAPPPGSSSSEAEQGQLAMAAAKVRLVSEQTMRAAAKLIGSIRFRASTLITPDRSWPKRLISPAACYYLVIKPSPSVPSRRRIRSFRNGKTHVRPKTLYSIQPFAPDLPSRSVLQEPGLIQTLRKAVGGKNSIVTIGFSSQRPGPCRLHHVSQRSPKAHEQGSVGDGLGKSLSGSRERRSRQKLFRDERVFANRDLQSSHRSPRGSRPCRRCPVW